MNLSERYRPKNLNEVIGQREVCSVVRGMIAREQIAGRAFVIAGRSGIGKTSIARLIAREVAGELAIEEWNARDLAIESIREMELSWWTTCLARIGEPNGRAYIFNECHLLRKDIVSRLLTTLEEIPPHVVLVFTTSKGTADAKLFEDYNDGMPFLDRCVRLQLRTPAAKEVAEHVKRIAVAERRDGRPIERYVELAERNRCSFRACLQSVESGVMA